LRAEAAEVVEIVAGLAQALEPVLVETLVSQPAVEALDERIVDRLAGPDEVARDLTRDLRDTHGRRFGPGVYLIHAASGTETDMRRVVVVK
jgi:hypothetical protein